MQAKDKQRTEPKGRLILIGGAEDKGGDNRPDIIDDNKEFRQYEILKELLPANGSSSNIEIITTASEQPKTMASTYKNAFKRLHCENVGFISIENKKDILDKSYIQRIEAAHAVMFSGGDQLRLSAILGGSEIIGRIKSKYINDSSFTVAGTSAGAMALANIMIYNGESHEALLKGSLRLSSGFGFLDSCIVDTHFVKRGRFGRLAQAVIINPSCCGIGLGEDTALVIINGNECECRGSGMITVIDSHDTGYSNLLIADDGTPLCIENLKVHILSRGNGFLLKERKFLPGKLEEEPG